MKLLKKSAVIVVVLSLLFSLLGFTRAIAGEENIVTIRMYEICKACIGPSKILVVEDGKTRVIELEKYEPKNPENSKNLEVLNSLIEQYYKAGYKIQTSTTGLMGGTTATVTTYILSK